MRIGTRSVASVPLDDRLTTTQCALAGGGRSTGLGTSGGTIGRARLDPDSAAGATACASGRGGPGIVTKVLPRQ